MVSVWWLGWCARVVQGCEVVLWWDGMVGWGPERRGIAGGRAGSDDGGNGAGMDGGGQGPGHGMQGIRIHTVPWCCAFNACARAS